MGPDDKVEYTSLTSDENTAIPGLDLDTVGTEDKSKVKKVPYSKPIPRNFQAQWNETGGNFNLYHLTVKIGSTYYLHRNASVDPRVYRTRLN